jgi:hypothetical protein
VTPMAGDRAQRILALEQRLADAEAQLSRVTGPYKRVFMAERTEAGPNTFREVGADGGGGLGPMPAGRRSAVESTDTASRDYWGRLWQPRGGTVMVTEIPQRGVTHFEDLNRVRYLESPRGAFAVLCKAEPSTTPQTYTVYELDRRQGFAEDADTPAYGAKLAEAITPYLPVRGTPPETYGPDFPDVEEPGFGVAFWHAGRLILWHPGDHWGSVVCG